MTCFRPRSAAVPALGNQGRLHQNGKILYANELGSPVHPYSGYAKPRNEDTQLVAEESSQTIVAVTTFSSEGRTIRWGCVGAAPSPRRLIMASKDKPKRARKKPKKQLPKPQPSPTMVRSVGEVLTTRH